MADEEKVFTILAVTKWNFVVSRVLGASRKSEKDTPQVIRVKCDKCGMTFEARESNSGRRGTFLGTLGGIQSRVQSAARKRPSRTRSCWSREWHSVLRTTRSSRSSR